MVGENIFGDLQATGGGGVHLALQVDAIRCLYTFRYQVRLVSSTRVGCLSLYLPRPLTKEQLVSVLYAYWRFDDAYVCLPSYRLVLVIKFCRFSSVDVQSFAPQLLNIILAKIGVQNSPERTAGNDFLMRRECAFSPHCVLCLISVLPRCCESYHHGEAGSRRGVRHCLAETCRNPPQSRSKPE